MAEIVDALINGAVFGSIIALASVGLTLIYGVLKIANFAHGDFLTLGAYLGWALLGVAPWIGPAVGLVAAVAVIALFAADKLTDRTGYVLLGAALLSVMPLAEEPLTNVIGAVPILGGIITAVPLGLYSAITTSALVMAGVGVTSHYALWKPLQTRGAKMVMVMIASIGLAFFVRGLVRFTWGGSIKTYDIGIPAIVHGPLDTSVTTFKLAAFVIATAGVAATHLFLTRTTTGKMLRALSDNPELAHVTGIDVPRMMRFTWGLGSALAGAGGVLYVTFVGSLSPEVGWTLLLTIFAVVILGGIGSAKGAILAAFIVAIAQNLSVVGMTSLETSLGTDVPLVGAQYKIAVGFLILIVTLLVRPQGLMGVKVR